MITPSVIEQPARNVTAISLNDAGSESRDLLRFLDGLRGLTALYVVGFHVFGGMLWEGFSGYLKHPQIYSLPATAVAYLSLLFSFGTQAVLVFFILSGFVIHIRYAREAQTAPKKKLEVRAFLWRRFKRIYPPLLWALLLTYVLDHNALLVTPPIQHIVQVKDITTYDPLGVRLTSALLLIPNPTPEWGSNLALWSLRLEWWFYLLYPVLWLINRRSIVVATAILSVLFAFSFIPVNSDYGAALLNWPIQIVQTIFSYMIVWWLGVLLAEIYVGRIQIKFSRLIPLVFGLIPLCIINFLPSLATQIYPVLQVFFWGLALTGLFATLFAWQNRGGSLRWLERLKPIGDMSYTLYITHGPTLVWLSVIILGRSPIGSLPTGFEWVIPGIALCLGSAYLAHFVVERPFQRRSRASSVMTAPQPVQPSS